VNLDLKRIYGFSALKKALAVYRFVKERNVKIVVTCHVGSDIFGGIVARLARGPGSYFQQEETWGTA